MEENRKDIEYRSGWKKIIRESTDNDLSDSNRTELNTRLSAKANKVIKPTENNSIKTIQNDDLTKILKTLESYKTETDNKLDNIINELDALVSLILEISTQKSIKKSPRLKKLLKNFGVK